jgi:hypothetical protein
VAAGDLTTVADVKASSGAGGAGTAADAVIARLITAASSFIATSTDRSFTGLQAFSEIRDGSGGDLLLLGNTPVVSIQSLSVGAVPIAAQAADGQPGYFLLNGEAISLYGYRFGKGRANVRVSYTAGYAAIPADVAQACIELVESMYRKGHRDPLQQSESNQGITTTSYKVQDVPPFVQSVIDKYKKVVPI